MNIKIFAELIELKAKAASVFPFLMGCLYSWYHYQMFKPKYTFLFFLSMLLFNMAVDILDNYMDYQHASDQHHYKEETNIIGRENLSLKQVRGLILGFIFLSALVGFYIASQTSWIILYLGIFSYAVGIFYSAGPKPLSSLPVGELTSGVTMGIVIPIVCVYLNLYNIILFDWTFVYDVLVLALPTALAISNLMLANNICDLQEDITNHRKTLVYYIGTKNAIISFKLLVFCSFVAATYSVVTGIAPLSLLFIWIIFPMIWRQTSTFSKHPNKTKTFPLAIKNLGMIAFIQTVLWVIGILV